MFKNFQLQNYFLILTRYSSLIHLLILLVKLSRITEEG